jgi:hypothetical protein
MISCAVSSLAACRKNKAQDEQSSKAAAAAAAKKDPAFKRSADEAKKSLEKFKAPLDDLNQRFAALHQHFDALPPDLPGFGDTRSRFYTASVGLGQLGAKIPWLAGRIDAAVKEGDRAELQRITADIAGTTDGIKQVERASVELLHQVMPFKKVAEERKEAGKEACEAPPPEIPRLVPPTATERP